MNQDLIFDFRIHHPPHQEQSFLVHDGQTCIRITLDIPFEKGIYTVLTVYDPSHCIRAMRQVGYGERILQISNSPETCSFGACYGKLEAGIWTIHAAIYPEVLEKNDHFPAFCLVISDQPSEVKEQAGQEVWMNQFGTILFDGQKEYESMLRWYAGDFHVHTHLSDGWETIPDQMEKARLAGLDFYTATEHNLMAFTWPSSHCWQ